MPADEWCLTMKSFFLGSVEIPRNMTLVRMNKKELFEQTCSFTENQYALAHVYLQAALEAHVCESFVTVQYLKRCRSLSVFYRAIIYKQCAEQCVVCAKCFSFTFEISKEPQY